MAVTYIMKITASDLSVSGAEGNRVMSTGTGSDTNFVVGGAGFDPPATEQHYFITLDTPLPNNDDFEDGNTTVEVEVDVSNMNIDCRAKVHRLNSSGVSQEAGAFASDQDLGVSRTFTCAVPAGGWTAGACSDRFAVEVEFESAAGMNQSVTIAVGATTNEVDNANLTENVAACAVGGVKGIPINVSAMI